MPMVQQFDSLLPPFNGGGDLLIPIAVGIDPVTQGVFVASDLDPKIQRFDFAETRLPGAGMLKLKLNAKGKRGINIAWKKGDSVALGDLGDPVSGGTVYHITLISGQTQVNYSIPPGAFSKSDGEGWKALPNGKGFLYKAKPGVNPTGITKMKLLVGENGKSKVIVVGKGNDAKGINLPLPPMPPTTAARVLISNGITVWDGRPIRSIQSKLRRLPVEVLARTARRTFAFNQSSPPPVGTAQ